MSKSKTGTEVATQNEDTSLALASEFEADAGAGLEGMEAEDFALPFIVLLQTNSPQLDPTCADYVEAARPGMFLNRLTGEVSKELTVVPCAYAFRVIERKPREQGGTFVARYQRQEVPGDAYVDVTTGQNRRQNGNVLVNTAYHYVLALGDNGPAQAVLSFRSTQLSKSKKWNGKMAALKFRKADGSLITPPTYSSLYKLTSGKESNEKGSWFGVIIERVGYVADLAILHLAQEFSKIAVGKKLAKEDSESEDRIPF